MSLELCPRCQELVTPRTIHDKNMVLLYCPKCQSSIRSYENPFDKEKK